MTNQAQAALAAWLLDRPVKCTLSREESFRIHAKRHPIRLEYWAGCDADGVLTAVRVRAVGDSGAYASVGMKVLERAAGHATGPYHVPAVDVEAIAARTNNLVCGAFRGFGANQAQFAMDGVLDRLAEAVGISGWEIRKRNVIRPGALWGPGQVMDDGAGGAEACLDAIKPAYDAAIAAGKAVGLGLGLKNAGLGNGFREVSGAVVRFHSDDDRVEVRHGWTEMGQGVHTVALQVAAQELGIDPARIDVIVDTTRQLGFGQTTGSRGTLMAAGAVQRACAAALADDCRPDVDHHGEHVVDWTAKLGDPDQPDPTIHAAFGYAAQLAVVDRESGKVERVVAVHDVGKAVNPQLCAGPDRGQRAHGPRLRPDRGLPDRSGDRLPDVLDAAPARHPAGQGRARDRGRARRGAPAALAVRHQGRRRDRPRADRPRRRRRPPRPRRRVAGVAADAVLTTPGIAQRSSADAESSVAGGSASTAYSSARVRARISLALSCWAGEPKRPSWRSWPKISRPRRRRSPRLTDCPAALPRRRLLVVGVLVEPRPAGVGELVALLAVVVDGPHEALVLELGEGRVDRAGARPPAPAGALLELADQLVAVHRPLGEHPQEAAPDRAAAGAMAVTVPVVTVAAM